MIKLTVTPKGDQDLYAYLVKKELELRRANRGTLHRSGGKRKDKEKWVHSSYRGWVQFQRCLGGVTVALVQARNPEEEWQLLTSFVGFLDRHFRDEISGINLQYREEE